MIEPKLKALLGERIYYWLFVLTEVMLAAAGITAVVSLFIALTLLPPVALFLSRVVFHISCSDVPFMWLVQLMASSFLNCMLLLAAGIGIQHLIFSRDTIKQYKRRIRGE